MLRAEGEAAAVLVAVGVPPPPAVPEGIGDALSVSVLLKLPPLPVLLLALGEPLLVSPPLPVPEAVGDTAPDEDKSPLLEPPGGPLPVTDTVAAAEGVPQVVREPQADAVAEALPVPPAPMLGDGCAVLLALLVAAVLAVGEEPLLALAVEPADPDPELLPLPLTDPASLCVAIPPLPEPSTLRVGAAVLLPVPLPPAALTLPPPLPVGPALLPVARAEAQADPLLQDEVVALAVAAALEALGLAQALAVPLPAIVPLELALVPALPELVGECSLLRLALAVLEPPGELLALLQGDEVCEGEGEGMGDADGALDQLLCPPVAVTQGEGEGVAVPPPMLPLLEPVAQLEGGALTEEVVVTEVDRCADADALALPIGVHVPLPSPVTEGLALAVRVADPQPLTDAEELRLPSKPLGLPVALADADTLRLIGAAADQAAVKVAQLLSVRPPVLLAVPHPLELTDVSEEEEVVGEAAPLFEALALALLDAGPLAVPAAAPPLLPVAVPQAVAPPKRLPDAEPLLHIVAAPLALPENDAAPPPRLKLDAALTEAVAVSLATACVGLRVGAAPLALPVLEAQAQFEARTVCEGAAEVDCEADEVPAPLPLLLAVAQLEAQGVCVAKPVALGEALAQPDALLKPLELPLKLPPLDAESAEELLPFGLPLELELPDALLSKLTKALLLRLAPPIEAVQQLLALSVAELEGHPEWVGVSALLPVAPLLPEAHTEALPLPVAQAKALHDAADPEAPLEAEAPGDADAALEAEALPLLAALEEGAPVPLLLPDPHPEGDGVPLICAEALPLAVEKAVAVAAPLRDALAVTQLEGDVHADAEGAPLIELVALLQALLNPLPLEQALAVPVAQGEGVRPALPEDSALALTMEALVEEVGEKVALPQAQAEPVALDVPMPLGEEEEQLEPLPSRVALATALPLCAPVPLGDELAAPLLLARAEAVALPVPQTVGSPLAEAQLLAQAEPVAAAVRLGAPLPLALPLRDKPAVTRLETDAQVDTEGALLADPVPVLQALLHPLELAVEEGVTVSVAQEEAVLVPLKQPVLLDEELSPAELVTLALPVTDRVAVLQALPVAAAAVPLPSALFDCAADSLRPPVLVAQQLPVPLGGGDSEVLLVKVAVAWAVSLGCAVVEGLDEGLALKRPLPLAHALGELVASAVNVGHPDAVALPEEWAVAEADGAPVKEK